MKLPFLTARPAAFERTDVVPVRLIFLYALFRFEWLGRRIVEDVACEPPHERWSDERERTLADDAMRRFYPERLS